MRLLLVEAEFKIQTLVMQALQGAGYEVHTTEIGSTASRLVSINEYDGLIVDLGLPDQDGLDLIRQLRCSGLSIPILIISARTRVEDRVRGLELGGDDYLTKPFAVAELLARIRNLLRRTYSMAETKTRIRVCDLELDLLNRKVSRAGQMLNLSPQEFVLLDYLCRNAGRVVTRSMLLAGVWGIRIRSDTNVVDVYIYRLRSKIDTAGKEPLIKTLRGVGYLFRSG